MPTIAREQRAPKHPSAYPLRMEVGELWVYQATKFDSIHCARVMSIGKRIKVKVQKPDWLKGTLKVERKELRCRWEELSSYRPSVQPFMDLTEMAGPSEAEWNAAEFILVETDLSDHINFHLSGCAETFDAELIARACKTSMETLTGAPGTIVDGAYVAFPWETVLKLVKRLARTRTETILENVRADRAFWEQRARDNATTLSGRLDPEDFERRKSFFDEFFKREYEVVHQWCGVRRSKESDELAELRIEYSRLLTLATSATQNMVRTKRAAALAAEINAIATSRSG